MVSLRGLFTKAEPVRKPTEAPVSPRAVIYRGSGQAVVVYDNVCKAQYALQHPVVARCLSLIANAVQDVKWNVHSKPGTAVTKRDVADISDLLDSPNDDMSAANFKYWLALSLACYGRAPVKVGVGPRGLANGLYPLDARYLLANTNVRGQVSSYEYTTQEKRLRFPSRLTARVHEPFAFEIATPTLTGDILDTKTRMLPLNSIGGPAKVLDALMLRTLATAKGHPNAKYIIWTEDDLSQEQLDQVDDYVSNHDTFGSESGKVMFLRSVKLNVEKLDSDLGDIHAKSTADDMTRMVFGAFGIPIALAGLGAADAAKFANNYAESRASFMLDTIIPTYLSGISSGLTRAIAPPGVLIEFDLDSIPALIDMRVNSMSKLKDVDFLSANEKREIFGFDPIG